MHLIIAIKWELFCKYHIKPCVFRDGVSKTKNILSFHTVWAESRSLLSTQSCLLDNANEGQLLRFVDGNA